MTGLLLLALACTPSGTPHEHDHEGGHSHDGSHAHHGAGGASTRDAGSDATAALGSHTAHIALDGEQLVLTLTTSEGTPVPASGEARVVLTGTGEAEQRLVLTADGERWVGAAKNAAAPGYTAIVLLELDGHSETARIAWGTVPAPAKAKPDAGHGHDHDHGGHGH